MIYLGNQGGCSWTRRLAGISFAFLIVISLFSRIYFDSVPTYYAQRAYFYYALVCFLVLVVSSTLETIRIPKTVGFLILFVVVSQLVTMLFQLNIHDHEFVVRKMVALFAYVFSIVALHVFVVIRYVQILGLETSYVMFRRGVYIVMSVVFLANAIQLAYLWDETAFQSVMESFGRFVEVRWDGEGEASDIHRFYRAGSYVQQTHRLNGMSEEASENASMLVVLFLPILYARIASKLASDRRKLLVIEYLPVLAIIFFLLAIKSSSAIFMAVMAVAVLLIILLNYRSIFAISLAIIVFLSAGWWLLATSSSLQDQLLFYVTKVFDWEYNESTNSRAAISYALLMVFISNPVSGVGRSLLSQYIGQYIPDWAGWNAEIAMWGAVNNYPILSAWLGLLAEYGAIGALVFIYVFHWVYRRLRILYIGNASQPIWFEIFYAYRLFLLFYCLSMLFAFTWYKSIYLLIFSFFLAVAMGPKKVLQ